MEIEGYCRVCHSTFDAHFTIMPIGKEKCPACGATGRENISTTTDESGSAEDVGSECEEEQ